MNRTITVKGIGSVKVKPDYVVISFSVKVRRKDYTAAVEDAGSKVKALQDAISGIGYEKSDIKTRKFDIDACYDYKKGVLDRSPQRVFSGYVCSYDLKLSFDFDNARLSKTLAAIAVCETDPELSIEFTVKNPGEVSDELLRSAAENAKRKAEIMCAGAGGTLGELLSVNYNWSEINIVSRTRYLESEDADYSLCSASMAEIEPDDIEAQDTADFVWAIL